MKTRTSSWQRWPAIAILFATQLSADFAPESADGMVLRTTYAVLSTDRSSRQATFLFYNDGSYFPLLGRTYGFLSSNEYRLARPPETTGERTYTYLKTGENTATLTFNSNPGSTRVLNFTSPTGGGQQEGGFYYYFSLIQMLPVESVPNLNISLRGEIRPDRHLIGGFVVPGPRKPLAATWYNPSHDREVLIRVVGPSLVQFEVEGVWSDPDFELFRDGEPFQQSQLLREDHYDDWWGLTRKGPGEEWIPADRVPALERVFEHVGAFPLLEGSKDAVQVERLPPGNYTVVTKADEGDPGGEALIEVYFLP